MINFNSPFQHLAKQSVPWLQLDSETNFMQNLKDNYKLMASNGWLDTEIIYSFNRHGFRCEDFSHDPTVMFLGCSNTFGFCLPNQQSWADIVAKKINLKSANLSCPAGTNDTSFRMCVGWIDIIKPKLVILLDPPGIRLEIVNNNDSELINVARFLSRTPPHPYNNFLTGWSQDDNNHHFNTMKNQLAIEYICKTRNIKFEKFTNEEFPRVPEDFARDLFHKGPIANRLFADKVVDRVSSMI
jgi:hypothetical protein